jgi:hypothetical protein
MRQNAILKGGAYIHCQMVLKQYGDLNVYSVNWRRNNSQQMGMSCQRDTLSYLQTHDLISKLNKCWNNEATLYQRVSTLKSSCVHASVKHVDGRKHKCYNILNIACNLFFFLLVTVLSVLLLFKASDYPFSIINFYFFLLYNNMLALLIS